LVADWQEEIERRIEDGIERGTRAQQDAWEDEREALSAQRTEARLRAQQAEGVLVGLITQLLPAEKKVYLYSAGIRELALGALNTVLGRRGLVVKSRETFSERQVKCQLGPQHWAQRSLFWVTQATPPGVVDEDDNRGEVQAPEGPPSPPGPLALPEGTGV
jgi:hypothetical protein